MPARAISIFATVLLIADTAILALRAALLGTGPVSLTLQALGIALVLWARVAFGYRSFHLAANPTKSGLITRGPYRFIRNPIYSGAWLIIWTGVAVHWSRSNALLALFAAAMLMVKMVCEEQLLRQAYPEYADYARKTPRLIPLIL